MSTSPYARGWYLVAWSAELVPGQVKPVQAFGKAFVLYRAEDGTPVLLDGHCPHLGAHLGHGGRVQGDSIVCPFHAWRFGAHGRCVEVPYATRIPPRAAVGAYRVAEHSGMILTFHAPDGVAPDYEVPVLPEVNDPAWTPLQVASDRGAHAAARGHREHRRRGALPPGAQHQDRRLRGHLRWAAGHAAQPREGAQPEGREDRRAEHRHLSRPRGAVHGAGLGVPHAADQRAPAHRPGPPAAALRA
jgi:nitrite reductase/ring-hydroxylating ferredoxin subunit